MNPVQKEAIFLVFLFVCLVTPLKPFLVHGLSIMIRKLNVKCDFNE